MGTELGSKAGYFSDAMSHGHNIDVVLQSLQAGRPSLYKQMPKLRSHLSFKVASACDGLLGGFFGGEEYELGDADSLV